MAGANENLPFDRGSTYAGSGTPVSGAGDQWVGREFIHEDLWYGTGKLIKVRVCRNLSGATLLGKRFAGFVATAGEGETEVNGYTVTTAQRGYVIDERLSAAGVAANDLFYVVIDGPSLVLTPLEGDATNVFVVGDYLHALTAVTTGATTAGRPKVAVFTGATATLAGQIQNVIGVAMSAKTTANTNASMLIDVRRF